jgi:hypothetical protein
MALEEDDIIRIRKFETIYQETETEDYEEDSEDQNETRLLTFDEKRKAIDNFYKENIGILRCSRRVVLGVEEENEKSKQAIEWS